jgi:hypothetical protein
VNTIENIFEPSRLFLVWHHSQPTGARSRRIVGELVKQGNDATFRYLKNTEDFEAALGEGFHEFPAFADRAGDASQPGAMDVFMRRLPPRKREDFKEYLSQYSLPNNFIGSDFALLGYTGARLASDNFELCPDLAGARAPLDLVIEATGTQYHVNENKIFNEGDEIFFEADPQNVHDRNAVQIIHQGHLIGYVNKALAPGFNQLLRAGRMDGRVLKFTERKGKARLLILARHW